MEELTTRVTEWRSLLEQQSGDTNRLLRQVLVGKVTMTPGEDGYRFKGTGTVQPIVAGLVPHNLASLMPASWNQIAAWLRQIDGLRQAA
jgi:hypothetical protein